MIADQYGNFHALIGLPQDFLICNTHFVLVEILAFSTTTARSKPTSDLNRIDAGQENGMTNHELG